MIMSISYLAPVLALLVGASGANASGAAHPSFAAWKGSFSVSFATPEEEALRERIFDANTALMDRHNAHPNATYRMATNQFSALTSAEFAAQLTFGEQEDDVLLPRAVWQPRELPDAVDWVAKGAVTAVKDQERCGSCWAFGATAAIESITMIRTAVLPVLSEQQIMDCCSNCSANNPPPHDPCEGGNKARAMQFVASTGGQTTELAYPYLATWGACNAAGLPVAATLDKARGVQTENETALLVAIANQPIAVSVMASDPAFQHYSSGVLTGPCGPDTDHSVLAVGFGVDYLSGPEPLPFFALKNSWGVRWGEAGYIRIARGPLYPGRGQCGVLRSPTVAWKDLEHGAPV